MNDIDKNFEVADSLRRSFSILYRHGRMMENHRIKRHRISGPQGGYLRIIHHNPGITQDTIAKMQNIDKSSVARAIKKLETENYVERRRNPEDSRSWCIYLTPQGEKLCHERQERGRHYEQKLFAGMTTEEINTLRRLLEKVTANMEDMSSEIEGRK